MVVLQHSAIFDLCILLSKGEYVIEPQLFSKTDGQPSLRLSLHFLSFSAFLLWKHILVLVP